MMWSRGAGRHPERRKIWSRLVIQKHPKTHLSSTGLRELAATGMSLHWCASAPANVDPARPAILIQTRFSNHRTQEYGWPSIRVLELASTVLYLKRRPWTMATQPDYQSLFDRVAALREQVANNLSADLVGNPQLADALTKQIDDLLASVTSTDGGTTPRRRWPIRAGRRWTFGLFRFRRYAHFVGRYRVRRHDHVGTDYGGRRYALSLAAREDLRLPSRGASFRSFSGRAAVRPSGGTGAFALYQWDRRQVLRYTQSRPSSPPIVDCSAMAVAPPPTGARPNTDFHSLFTHFIQQVTLYGATSASRTPSASAPTILASARSRSSADPASTCATTSSGCHSATLTC